MLELEVFDFTTTNTEVLLVDIESIESMRTVTNDDNFKAKIRTKSGADYITRQSVEDIKAQIRKNINKFGFELR